MQKFPRADSVVCCSRVLNAKTLLSSVIMVAILNSVNCFKYKNVIKLGRVRE